MTKPRRWSIRSESNMKGIHPHLRAVLDEALHTSPVDFIVIEGLRDKERQAQLVAQGASMTMNSRHLTGHAVDLLPIDPADGRGKFEWPLYHQLAPAMKEAAESLGVPMVWGGDWTRLRDGPHFELERHAYPVDAPIKPLSKSRTIKAGVAAGAGGAGIAIADAIEAVEPLAHFSDTLRWVFVALVLAGAAWAIYARIDDAKQGVK